jgi:hypothetical protein
MTTSNPKPKSWRDYLEVHPAAELSPMMSDAELDELGKDILAHNGLLYEVVFSKGALVDGRNRLEATQRAGIELDWANLKDSPFATATDMDPYDYVLSANLRRRHLTAEQKRESIAKVLKAKPEASDREIGRQTKTDGKTVGILRGELEGRAEIPHVETRTDSKGRKQPSRKSKSSRQSPARNRSRGGSGHKRVYEIQLRLLNDEWKKAGQSARQAFVREHSEEISALLGVLSSSNVQGTGAGSAEQSVDEVTSDAAAAAS